MEEFTYEKSKADTTFTFAIRLKRASFHSLKASSWPSINISWKRSREGKPIPARHRTVIQVRNETGEQGSVLN